MTPFENEANLEIASLREKLRRKQDEKNSLVAENERLAKMVWGERAKLADENERLTARAEKAEAYMDQFAAESNRLREALRPFAECMNYMQLTQEVFNNARAALRLTDRSP